MDALNLYFDRKQRIFRVYFNNFHQAINEVQKAVLRQIQRQVKVTRQIFQNDSHPEIGNRIKLQIQKMESRQQNILAKITGSISTKLLNNFKKTLSSEKQSQSPNTISNFHQISKNIQTIQNSPDKQFKLKSTQILQNIHSKNIQIKQEIPYRKLSGKKRSSSKNNRQQINQKSLSKIITETPLKSKQNTQQICQTLDKKIHQTALQFLYKQKIKTSPQKRNRFHSSPKKTSQFKVNNERNSAFKRSLIYQDSGQINNTKISTKNKQIEQQNAIVKKLNYQGRYVPQNYEEYRHYKSKQL